MLLIGALAVGGTFGILVVAVVAAAVVAVVAVVGHRSLIIWWHVFLLPPHILLGCASCFLLLCR